MRNTVKGAVLACVSALIASLFVVLQMGSATAATYPPTTCATISVSTTTPDVGQSITVTGEEFTKDSSVTLYLTPAADYKKSVSAAAAPAGSSVLLTTVTTDGNGAFSAQVTMPPGATGNQIISADGTGKICPADPIQIKVSGSGAGGGGSTSTSGSGGNGGGGTAMTGVDVALLVAIALALLTAGAIFSRGGRRKRVSLHH